MEQWYRDKSKEIVTSRVKYYQRFFNIQPTDIRIKEQKKRWGRAVHQIMNYYLIVDV
jgi:hypothetical protein